MHVSYVHAASTVAGNTCFQLTGPCRAGGEQQLHKGNKEERGVLLPPRHGGSAEGAQGSKVKVNEVFLHRRSAGGTCAGSGECFKKLEPSKGGDFVRPDNGQGERGSRVCESDH